MTNLPMQKCDDKSDTVINSTIAFLPGREYACTPKNIYVICMLYSVIQSDGNSFCGDVVLDSFNMVYSVGTFNMKILNFKSD